MADVDMAEMTGFEVRDALRKKGGNNLDIANFNDEGEEPVTVIAASGQLALIFRQILGAFEGDGTELKIILPKDKRAADRDHR